MHSQQQVNQNPAARMMKDSEIEWIGMIPNEWEVVRVKNLFRATKRIVGDAADKYERLALTLNGVIKRSKEDSEGLQPEKFEGYQILKENELVFKLIDLENLRTSRVGLSPYTGLVSPAYIVLTNDSKDNRFPYYYFMSMYYRAIFNSLGGDGVRSALNKLDLLNIPYVYPPLHEQQAIATYLDEQVGKMDKLISDQKQAIEKWKEYKQSLITETVTKGLNPNVEMKDSGIEWIGEIPTDWGLMRVKHLFRLATGATPKTDEKDNWGSELIWVTPVDFGAKHLSSSLRQLSLKGYNSCGTTLVPKNSILITCRAPIGSVALAGESLCFNQGCKALVNKNFNVVENYFYYYFVSNSQALNLFGKGTTFLELSSTALNNFPIPNPPLHEQQAIANYLDDKCAKIDQTIEQKQELIKQLEEYKQSLIYECVTGKRRVG